MEYESDETQIKDNISEYSEPSVPIAIIKNSEYSGTEAVDDYKIVYPIANHVFFNRRSESNLKRVKLEDSNYFDKKEDDEVCVTFLDENQLFINLIEELSAIETINNSEVYKRFDNPNFLKELQVNELAMMIFGRDPTDPKSTLSGLQTERVQITDKSLDNSIFTIQRIDTSRGVELVSGADVYPLLKNEHKILPTRYRYYILSGLGEYRGENLIKKKIKELIEADTVVELQIDDEEKNFISLFNPGESESINLKIFRYIVTIHDKTYKDFPANIATINTTLTFLESDGTFHFAYLNRGLFNHYVALLNIHKNAIDEALEKAESNVDKVNQDLNAIYFAKYSEDSLNYRAKIKIDEDTGKFEMRKNEKGQNEINVFFIDYGNTEYVTNLVLASKICKFFDIFPNLCYKGKLAGISYFNIDEYYANFHERILNFTWNGSTDENGTKLYSFNTFENIIEKGKDDSIEKSMISSKWAKPLDSKK